MMDICICIRIREYSPSSLLVNHSLPPSSYKFPAISKTNNLLSSCRFAKNSSPKTQNSLSNQCSTSQSFQTKNSTHCSPYSNLSSTSSHGFSVKPEKVNTSNCDFSPQALMSLYNTLQTNIELSEDYDLHKLDEKIINVLAVQRLQQLFPKKKQKLPVEKTNSESNIQEVRGRAVVCPVEKKGLPVPMCYRTLHLGIGYDMDVCFPFYGFCNYVSPKHASIFYDEITQRYELINYSPFGTTVDNVIFTTDVSEKQKPAPHPNSLSAAVRKLAKSSMRMADLPPPVVSPEKPVVSARGKQHFRPCKCKTNPSNLVECGGWENSAVLHHGSFIQCGCLQFVFSIAEYGIKLEPVEDRTMLLRQVREKALAT